MGTEGKSTVAGADRVTGYSPLASARKYSRLVVPRRAQDDSVVGLLSLHAPLGFLEDGEDLVACFRDASAAREACAALTAGGHGFDLVTDIPEGDPLEAFRAASRPFPVGRRLWIDPGDPSDSSAPAGRIAIRVPASRAFGTGGHESTRLALLALEDSHDPGGTVLDAGTGSGILALAAAALGSSRAVGFDLDAEALFVARENLRRHPFGRRVALLAGPVTCVWQKFATVVANLLPDELLPIRADLAARVAPRGRLIVSGIPAEREREVARPLRAGRLHLVSRREERGWICLCLERASS